MTDVNQKWMGPQWWAQWWTQWWPLLVCVVLVGCGSSGSLDSPASGRARVATSEAETKKPTTSTVTDAATELAAEAKQGASGLKSGQQLAVETQLSQSGSVAFSSRRGQDTGAAVDFRLTLQPMGIAKVEYFGGETGTETVSGNYVIGGEGKLRLDFGPDDPWPPMQLTLEEGVLVVSAPDKEEIIQAAVQSGIDRDEITDDDLELAFDAWPLKQLQR